MTELELRAYRLKIAREIRERTGAPPALPAIDAELVRYWPRLPEGVADRLHALIEGRRKRAIRRAA